MRLNVTPQQTKPQAIKALKHKDKDKNEDVENLILLKSLRTCWNSIDSETRLDGL
jgi:hypothetical protein